MPSPVDHDTELAGRARDGDRAAFGVLVKRYSGRLVAFLIRACGIAPADAEDLAQNVWLKAFAAVPGWTDGHFRGWLFRIAHNAAADYRKKHHRRRAAPLDSAPEPAAAERPTTPEIDDEVARLRGCLETLPAEFPSAFEGYAGGKSYAEMAAESGTPEGTLRTRMTKARKALRACMGVDDA